MFESVLVANRGEVARRVIRTVRASGGKAIAVYADADADLPFVEEADEALLIGPAEPTESYLDTDAIMEAARRTHARAVHPGHGFLADSAAFARRVIDEGMTWIGPSPDVIAAVADKTGARDLMERAGLPVTGRPAGPDGAHDEEARAAHETARDNAGRSAGDPGIPPERPIESARHVEVQILGLADGTVLSLGERDCSVRRRNQKIVEETPSPGVGAELREAISAAAVRAGERLGYRGAGTVECLVDPVAQAFVFLELNARLQAEYPITELVTGVDLVEQQLRIAAGEPVSFEQARPRGHALGFHVHAEDPVRFRPGAGEITVWEEPAGPVIRVDAGYRAGNTVTSFYDPLLARLCVYGADRERAMAAGRDAVASFRIDGPEHNLPFFTELLDDDEFTAGGYDTAIVERMRG